MTGFLLSPEQRVAVEQIAETSFARIRQRANLLLLYDAGHRTKAVSKEIGLSPSQTRFWKQSFQTKGLAIFPKFTPEQNTDLEKITILSETNTSPTKMDVSLPYPRPQENPGITPDDSMAEAGRKILLYHFSRMLKHEPGTRLGEDSEELHDMRVATRRMRSAFLIFSDAYQPKISKAFQKGLRKIGSALGRVRDLDVFMENALVYLDSLPAESRNGLDPLLQSWQADLPHHRTALLEHLDSNQFANFKDEFNRFLQTPGMGVDLQKPAGIAIQLVRHAVPTLVYSRLASVMAFDLKIPHATFQELHALRIEFKQFRYTLEFFKEVLGPEAAEIVEEIKSLQDHLGEMNDAQVACQIIAKFLDQFEIQQTDFPIIERKDPTAIITYQATCYTTRYQKMLTFPMRWGEFKRPELRQKLALSVSVL